VKSFPNGLETEVDEAGNRFSGGERHRFALARVLLGDAPIVVLDEIATGLDPITESEILARFMEVLKDKTVIWVTHHLLGIEKMDHVLFLTDGTVTLDGTPDELTATSEHFQKLLALDRGV
jgi:ATP-binding cassette subfamily C protein CydC